MTAVPAAMPTPIMVTSPLACSNANAGIISANTSILAPFASRLALSTCSLLLVVAEHCQLDVDLREYSEYISLQYGHEDLEPVEHNRKWYGDERYERAEVQDQAKEHVDDQVPGQDVGVEPHPEREGLGELTEHLDAPHKRNHDELERQPGGREALEIRPSAVAPEAFVLGEDEREQRKDQRERDVGGDGVSVWYQPDQVQGKDKNEERERVRKPLLPLLPYLSAEVTPEAVHFLDDNLVRTWPVFEQATAYEQRQERHGRPDPQKPDGLVDRDVHGPYVQRYVPGVLRSLESVQDLLYQINPGEPSKHRQHGPEAQICGNTQRPSRETAPRGEGECPYHHTKRHVRSPQQRDRQRRREQAHEPYPNPVAEGFGVTETVDIQEQRRDGGHQRDDPSGAPKRESPVISHHPPSFCSAR